MANFLKAALEYQRLGLSVIPLISGQKKPAISFKEYQGRCATPEEIVEWWHKWPDSNIGIVTGKVSNLFVVDLDKYKEGYDPSIELEFFDNIETPTSLSPRGGHHLYFSYEGCEGLTLATDVFPGIDYRGEGGYITAPPSINGTGKPYEWIIPIQQERVALTASFLKRAQLNNSTYNKTNSLYRVSTELSTGFLSTDVHGVHKCLQEGNRNSDIFTIATALAKGQCNFQLASQVIEILANSANPPYDVSEAKKSLESAFNRKECRERNIFEEVKEYVLTQKCLQEVHISSTDCTQCLQLSTRNEKKAVYQALYRLCNEDKLLEKQGETRGLFKIVDNKIDEAVMDLKTESEIKEVNVRLPLDLNKMCVISPGNIIVISGSKSSGKTCMTMNIAWLNQDRFEVRYLNSEMHENEFKKRMKKFGPLSKWKIKGYKCHNNFHEFITGDAKHLYIVDFLEIHDNFYEIAKLIRKIHEKLGDSVCIINIQMKAGASLGRGGDFSAEKARLYLTMDFVPEALKTRVTIYDAKEPRPPEENLRGMFKMVKIIEGNALSDDGNWKR